MDEERKVLQAVWHQEDIRKLEKKRKGKKGGKD